MLKRLKQFLSAAALALLASSTFAGQIMVSGPPRHAAGSQPPVVGNTVVTFQLTSTPGGTALPFMVGQGFKEGDVPNGSDIVSDTSGVVLRGVCKKEWDDGSCKHMALVGTVTATAATPKTITLKTGTSAGGVALTCADIATDAPSASVAITGVGTVNLSSLLASPFRTWVSTPEMVECHYRSAVGSDTDLAALFYVKMWANGTNFVRAAVENGYVGGSPTNETHAVTVTIGSSTPINGTTITQYPWTRYDATGWIGTDPQIYLTHDVSYLISTKLVPNFASYARDQAPSSTILNSFDTSFAPMDSADFDSALGAGGASDWIGPLPQIDSLCVTTSDSRACNAADVSTRSMGVFSLHRRSSSTFVNPRPADFSTTTYNSGNGCGGSHGDVINDGFNWDVAHAPLQGEVSYLRSADYYYLEELSFQAQTYYFCRANSNGNGVNRTMRGYQNRAVGWGFNIVGTWLALAPDDGPLTADANAVANYATWFGNVVTNMASTVNSNGLGIPYMFSTGGWPTDVGVFGSIAPWMTHFWVYSVGHCLDIQCLSNTSSLITLSTDLFKFPVGLLGPTGAGNFHFTRAGRYGLFVDPTATGTDFGPEPTDFLDDWGAVYTGTTGEVNNETSNTLSGDSGSNPAISSSYWNNLNISIVAAVNHNATGADAAFLRLDGATNWPPAGSGTDTCDNKPNFCIEPWDTVTAPPGDTSLANAAATLSANQSLKFGTIPSAVIAPSGAPTTMYGSSGVYDHIRHEVSYVGKRNSTGAPYTFLVYDEATDTWSTNRTLYTGGSSNQTGHGYDHNAFDPATGDHYVRPYNDTDVWKWNGSWSSVTALPNIDPAAAITWFPGIGLIYSDCRLIRKLSGGSWTTLASGFAASQNHTISEYNKTANVMIFGSGNCFDTMRKMTSSEVITTIETPPFNVSSSENDGLLSSVPNEDGFVGWEKTTDHWTYYDVSDDDWSSLTQSTGSGASPQSGTPNIGGFVHCINITIEDYDVVMYVCSSGSNDGEVWLYKH